MTDTALKILTFVNFAFFVVNFIAYIMMSEDRKILDLIDRNVGDVSFATKSLNELIEIQNESIVALHNALKDHCKNDSLHK